MGRFGRFGLALVLLLPACGGCGADDPGDKQKSAHTSSAASTGGSEEPKKATSSKGSEEPAPEPSPPPEVTVRARPDALDGIGLVVESRGSSPSRLSPEVQVERETDKGWEPVATLSLRWSCGESTPTGSEGCVTLAPGAEMRPPAWERAMGKAQCGCEDCEAAEEGRYRFVVQSCKEEHRLEGEAFALEP